MGVVYAGPLVETSVSLFYSDVRDYVLIESRYPKGPRLATITRNVDATTWGGEADLAYALSRSWRLSGTLAYTHGSNDTDELPLAQIPPLEARMGVDWARAAWTVGGLVRLVAEQDRFVVNQGNIVGQDLGPTDGFAVASLNVGWKPSNHLQLTAGLDNVFDNSYAEHQSRAGSSVAGYEQTERVNEPGRTLWFKVNGSFGKGGPGSPK